MQNDLSQEALIAIARQAAQLSDGKLWRASLIEHKGMMFVYFEKDEDEVVLGGDVIVEISKKGKVVRVTGGRQEWTRRSQFINECTLKHEDDHHGAQSCSSQCPGLARNQMPPYWPWHWEECHAYRIEWHCLKVKQSLCSTVQCRIDIGARMAQIRVYAHATYGGCDVTSSLQG